MQTLLKRQDDSDEGRAEGRAEGIDIGESKKATEMARSLLQDQLPIEFISKHTGLSTKEIENLKAEISG